mgnify:FL=1
MTETSPPSAVAPVSDRDQASRAPAPAVAAIRPSIMVSVVHWPALALLVLIRLYQRLLSPALPALLGPGCGCRFSPTCSHYAIEAIASRGVLVGSWLALRRLLKCTPFHPGGFDPVPSRLPPRCTRVTA